MAKKTNRKLGLKKETLRALSERELGGVVGARDATTAGCTYTCQGGNGSFGCGSQTWTCTADSCGCTIESGGIIIKY